MISFTNFDALEKHNNNPFSPNESEALSEDFTMVLSSLFVELPNNFPMASPSEENIEKADSNISQNSELLTSKVSDKHIFQAESLNSLKNFTQTPKPLDISAYTQIENSTEVSPDKNIVELKNSTNDTEAGLNQAKLPEFGLSFETSVADKENLSVKDSADSIIQEINSQDFPNPQTEITDKVKAVEQNQRVEPSYSENPIVSVLPKKSDINQINTQQIKQNVPNSVQENPTNTELSNFPPSADIESLNTNGSTNPETIKMANTQTPPQNTLGELTPSTPYDFEVVKFSQGTSINPERESKTNDTSVKELAFQPLAKADSSFDKPKNSLNSISEIIKDVSNSLKTDELTVTKTNNSIETNAYQNEEIIEANLLEMNIQNSEVLSDSNSEIEMIPQPLQPQFLSKPKTAKTSEVGADLADLPDVSENLSIGENKSSLKTGNQSEEFSEFDMPIEPLTKKSSNQLDSETGFFEDFEIHKLIDNFKPKNPESPQEKSDSEISKTETVFTTDPVNLEATKNQTGSDIKSPSIETIGLGKTQQVSGENFSTINSEIQNINSEISEANVEPQEVINQVRSTLSEFLLTDSSELEEKPEILKLRLRPAELGEVEIQLEKNSLGKLTVHFETENELAEKILVDGLEQLQDNLQDSGWQVENLDISTGSNGSTSSNGFEYREDYSSREQFIEDQAEEKSDFDKSEQVDDSNEKDQMNRLVNLRA